MFYLILSTTLFTIALLIIEAVHEFLFQSNNPIFKVVSIVIICIMVFVNGIIKGKNDIPDQTFHHVYMIFAIVFIIGHILINKNQGTVL